MKSLRLTVRMKSLFWNPFQTFLSWGAVWAMASFAGQVRAQGQFPFDRSKLDEMDRAMEEAIADHRMPGGVLWVERGSDSHVKAHGHRAVRPQLETMTLDTFFDLASLTKVVATAPAVMLLVERGVVDSNMPVSKYIEEFQRNGKERVLVRHLLTHTSGLRAGFGSKPEGYRSAVQLACQESTTHEPGTFFRYSDINFILLGEIVERVAQTPFPEFVRSEIFIPLKMNNTTFSPSTGVRAKTAPTETDGTNMLRGIVHDPTARRMGGAAGHAGLFSTANDLARFARMMLSYGELDGVRVFQPETIRSLTAVQSSALIAEKRGYGWDIGSAYSRPRGQHFRLGSYGHTGFTGTSIWIDPGSNSFWILLTNRVHPDGKGNVLALQSKLGTLAAEAIGAHWVN
jgi:CubicO group peptidase (beta-lactamase class C family)